MTRFLLLVAVVALCCAVHVKPADGTEDIVAETPVYRVGDEWRFTGGVYPGFVRVVAVEGDQIVTEFKGYTRCEGCRVFRDANLITLKVLDAKGEPWPDAIIGEKRLDFPLRVGKEWTQTIDLRTAGGPVRPYLNRFKVEAFEDVSVKAGRFKAFRIVQHQENRSSNWRGIATSWWAPDVRWWVKFGAFRGLGLSSSGGGRDTELESYSLK